MDTEKLTNAGVNVQQGMARFLGNKALYEKFLGLFPTQTEYKTMCTAIAEKNAESAFQAAHELKGVTGNLSLNRLHKEVTLITEQLRKGSIEGAEALLPQIAKAYEEVCDAINSVK